MKTEANVRAAAAKKTKATKADTEADVTFVVIQENVRSLKPSDRIEELLQEVDRCKWDALLLSESWRSSEAEIWTRRRNHIEQKVEKEFSGDRVH